MSDTSRRIQPRSGSTLLAQVLAGNALAVTALVFITVIALRLNVSIESERAALLVPLTAVAFSLALNIFVLRRQFAPLDDLMATMRKIDLARPGARASVSNKATADIGALTDAFNEMIARLEDERLKNTRAAIAAQEGERARVARDLHDEVNQALTAILLRLEAATIHAPPQLGAELAELKQLTNRAMDELLQLARRLRPTALDHGLSGALEVLVRDFERTSKIAVKLNIRVDPTRLFNNGRKLSNEEELVLYRVAQEALSNVAQHAAATLATVEFTVDDEVTLRIKDDGIGFDPDDPTHRYGIAGMRERALLVGGRLAIESRPREGTAVTLKL